MRTQCSEFRGYLTLRRSHLRPSDKLWTGHGHARNLPRGLAPAPRGSIATLGILTAPCIAILTKTASANGSTFSHVMDWRRVLCNLRVVLPNCGVLTHEIISPCKNREIEARKRLTCRPLSFSDIGTPSFPVSGAFPVFLQAPLLLRQVRMFVDQNHGRSEGNHGRGELS